MEMLDEELIPWVKKAFGWDNEAEEYEEEWTYQQDTAPSHKAKETQAQLRKNVSDFITIKEWPPYSLEPAGLRNLIYLEAKACEKPHESIKSLKKAIKKAWDEMPDDMVKRVVDSWPGRLQAYIDAEGRYIE